MRVCVCTRANERAKRGRAGAPLLTRPGADRGGDQPGARATLVSPSNARLVEECSRVAPRLPGNTSLPRPRRTERGLLLLLAACCLLRTPPRHRARPLGDRLQSIVYTGEARCVSVLCFPSSSVFHIFPVLHPSASALLFCRAGLPPQAERGVNHDPPWRCSPQCTRGPTERGTVKCPVHVHRCRAAAGWLLLRDGRTSHHVHARASRKLRAIEQRVRGYRA